MILGTRGQTVQAKFVFVSEGEIYDPTSSATPIDIYFSLIRGENRTGPVVDGPFSYLRGNEDLADRFEITRSGTGQFTFSYTIPATIMPGVYTILAQTVDDFGQLAISSPLQVKGEPIVLNPVVISSANSAVFNYKPTYDDLNRANTGTICLIGHADNLELNVPVKVRSIQSAIDILGADIRSPLLRGVFDAYQAGARDLFVMAAAPLGEYVEFYEDRIVPTTMFELEEATPRSLTFYEKYYERLFTSYSTLTELDFIDFVVPLEASIIKTGGVDFVGQLAAHLLIFHNTTGFVQLGVIGSRSGGVKSADVQEIKSTKTLIDKFTIYDSSQSGQIVADYGRFVIPIYGEGVMQHSQLKASYTSSMAATYAGMMASMPLNLALIRTRLPGVMSVYGNDLTQAEINELESIGMNTIYRGRRTRRSMPFEVYGTNEYTLANMDSTLSKATQMRIVAAVVNQVKGLATDSIGKFGYDRAVEGATMLLRQMQQMGVLVDFTLNVEVDKSTRGRIILYIELVSSLGLRKIDFAIAAGPEA